MIPPMSKLATLVAAVAAICPSMTVAQAVGNIECFNGSPNDINADDMQRLINDLRSVSIQGVENPVDLRSVFTIGQRSDRAVFLGTARTVIRNNQPFSSTHVKQEDWGLALQQVKDQCCGSFPTCIGGSTGVKGDTGLVVELRMERKN